MQKITPFLWFHGQAEAAAKFYVSVFKQSKLLSISRYPENAPAKRGSVMTVKFRILGEEFVALNGGDEFRITPAISFVVNCDTQKEVDYYWKKLTSGGGKEVQCGWLEDKFGVSWQIVPSVLFDLIDEKDRKKSDRVMQVVMESVKLDVKALKAAAKKNKT